METILDFFNGRKGRLRGFRFKDWADFQGTNEDLGAGDNSTTAFQLRKQYTSGGQTYNYTVRKPVSGTTTVKIGASVGAAISDTQGWAIAPTTGIITFTAVTANISAITKANPGVITTSGAHGLTTGHSVHLASIGGMTQLNNTRVAVTVLSSTTFSIGVDTTGYGTYTSGGTAKTLPQTGENVYATFEYDVPVRFDNDAVQIRPLSNTVFQLDFDLIEVRED